VLRKSLSELATIILPFESDVSVFLDKASEQGKKIVFEGAQGVMLDISFGTFPYITSSHTIAGAVCTGCGISPKKIDYILGIAKAYTTRVGSGPFVTEELGEIGSFLREKGGEYGTVTKRPRRCGWLDLVALKSAIRLSGIDSLVITKLDVLGGLESLKVCVEYIKPAINGSTSAVETPPSFTFDYDGIEPVYKTLKGWDQDISKANSYSQLPIEVKDYITLIEDYLACPVTLLGVGQERNASIKTKSFNIVGF
jgi:adenylosuccinate synthase